MYETQFDELFTGYVSRGLRIRRKRTKQKFFCRRKWGRVRVIRQVVPCPHRRVRYVPRLCPGQRSMRSASLLEPSNQHLREQCEQMKCTVEVSPEVASWGWERRSESSRKSRGEEEVYDECAYSCDWGESSSSRTYVEGTKPARPALFFTSHQSSDCLSPGGKQVRRVEAKSYSYA